uniref:NADH dehydrogenase subunit 6 n=1 Tax=Platorchestia sp. AKP-2018 TaxID=2306295 RepID=A0A385UKT5_9CRUS|nr:NADH dehydrogenase subunit 6 [Platorchestia sp. AKP-2018]
MLFFLSSITYISLLFIQLTTPLSMGLSIIIMATLISVLIFSLILSSWFSFLLIMIFLSGMMIIFIYISSLASNEILFHVNNMFIFPLVLLYMIYNYKQMMNMNSNNNLVPSLPSYSFEMMYKVYTPSIYAFTIFLIIYLLLALIVVVKNSSMKQAPLRMK